MNRTIELIEIGPEEIPSPRPSLPVDVWIVSHVEWSRRCQAWMRDTHICASRDNAIEFAARSFDPVFFHCTNQKETEDGPESQETRSD